MELRLPIDFERLPDFQITVAELQRLEVDFPHDVALVGWIRLWVQLAYQAGLTRKAGLLTEQGKKLFLLSMNQHAAKTFEALVAANVLVSGSVGEPVSENWPQAGSSPTHRPTGSPAHGSWFCNRFASSNEHLSPDFKKREKLGNEHSIIRRRERGIAQEANHQVMLLPAEIYKRRDGTTMDAREAQRVMILIKSLDNCLGKRLRQTGEFTEGLMADAAYAQSLLPEDKDGRYQFLCWISDHREHPAMPPTTEQILANIEDVLKMRN